MSDYPPVSACVFIRNTFKGAFCVFESMASLLPFVSDFLVMDLGSDDGTLHYLERIAEANPRVRLVHGEFSYEDAGVFASLANDLVAMCEHENVLYYQSDEIWHQDLLLILAERFLQGEFDWSFWRIQYRENFQVVKWFPQLVHRVGNRDDGSFNFIGDGMSTDRTFDAPICSQYGGEYFPRWGEMGQEGVKPYTNEMILDVSLVGAFLENIPERRAMHAPFWHEEPSIENLPASQWMARERGNPNWTKTTSPYNIPHIMEFHVGRPKYELRRELFEALCQDNTRPLLGL